MSITAQKMWLSALTILLFGGISMANDSAPLKPCKDSPNCASSLDERPSFKVTPLSFAGDASEALKKVKDVLLQQDRTRLVEESDGYLHVEFKSLIFRFVDDLEVWIDDSEKLIHFRSASRVGYSDFGVNKKRILEIQEKLKSQL